jgi:hypothetical protein
LNEKKEKKQWFSISVIETFAEAVWATWEYRMAVKPWALFSASLSSIWDLVTFEPSCLTISLQGRRGESYLIVDVEGVKPAGQGLDGVA